jgi:hypothetical protein
LLWILPAAAQDTITVPDLTGLSVPEAAATLNRVGLGIGSETGERWTEAAGQPQNTIAGQSIAPGSEVEPGTRLDVTVLRSPNVTLIYDDNDLTLVNQSGSALDLTGLTFQALDGNQATFSGSRWGRTVREDRCTQIWSVGRNGPKGLDECQFIEHWLVTTNRGEHFWTAGATRFAVVQNGVERAVCAVANPGSCTFYLPTGGGSADVTPYVYFAYTPDRLAIINNSEDQWMPLAGFEVVNNYAPNRGARVEVASPSLLRSINPVANTERLAPGQCIFFTNSSPEVDAPPQPCEVVARLNIGPSVIFWGADFPVNSVTDDQDHICPVATPDRLTVCIMPR